MGRVTSPDCEHARGLIAMGVLGLLTESEQIALVAHTDGCPECRDEQRELAPLSAVLPSARLGALETDEMPVELRDSVLESLERETSRDRSRRLHRYVLAAVGAAAAVVVALALAVGLSSTGLPTSKTVALEGQQGVVASVDLTAESWGTSVHIDASGQPRGQVMWVSMRTTAGSWWQAGTYRSVKGHNEVDLACAIRLSTIESVWVRNSSGHVVLHGYVS